MDTYYTHIAAIVVGVAITLAVIGQVSGRKTNEDRSLAATGGNAITSSTNKNKKKKKKSKTGTDGVVAGNAEKEEGTAVTSKVPPVAADVTSPSPAKTNGKGRSVAAKSTNGPALGGGKKKKNKKKTANGTTKAATGGGIEAATMEVDADLDSETEQEPEPVPAPPAAVVPAYVPSPSPPAPRSRPEADEEWSHVKDTKKKSKNKKGGASGGGSQPKAAAATSVAPAISAPTNGAAATSTFTATAPITTTTTESVTVDAKKVGIIIGPKGATMQAIQAATGCKLDINAPTKDENAAAGAVVGGGVKRKPQQVQTATIVITGTGDADAMKKAKTAIKELATRGYATLLQSDTFGEQSVRIHPRYLSEIVGAQGRVIQAIQSQLNVKITIPPTEWKPTLSLADQQRIPLAKVGVAGDDKQNVVAAKEVIESLVKYHHHEVTHPGTIHDEVYVPQEFFHCVIGTRGSEIKHIRGNFGVDIYMPNQEWDDRETVLVVGKATNVERAIAYINRLMERDTEQRAKKYNDEFYG